MAGGCCTTAAALIGCKRPISWLRYKTKKVEPKCSRRLMQQANAVALSQPLWAASTTSIKRGHKPSRRWRPASRRRRRYAPPTWCRRRRWCWRRCATAWSKWRRLTVLPLPPFTRILPQQLYYYYYKLFLPELTWKELSWRKISFLCRWFCIIDYNDIQVLRSNEWKGRNPSRYLTKKIA